MSSYRVHLMRPSERAETGRLMDELGFGPGNFPDGRVFVALYDGRIIGFGVLRGYGRHTGHLTMAGVHRRHRGHGLQRRLIRARVNLARRLGLRAVRTFTHESNHYSMNNLIRCGFRVDRQTCPGEIRFVKHLQPQKRSN